jgi:Cytochrome c554 and c-prime
MKLLALIFPLSILFLALFPLKDSPTHVHTEAQQHFFQNHPNVAKALLTDSIHPSMFLGIDSSVLFPLGKRCGGCHGSDPQMRALITNSDEDVNMFDDWRSSMMANSARDPFWLAKVNHEILVNPSHSLDLQDKCTSCHAPLGHYQAKRKGKKIHYTLEDLRKDSLGLDGVSCQACHAQAPGNLGALHSGQINFDSAKIRVAYGPYEVFFEPPMRQFVGITPLYGPHIGDAGICAGCHSLITKSVDYEGKYTGKTFVEQATYHEWLNSRYDSNKDNITCQGCHVPQIADEVIISANYQNLTPKFPYGVHELAGANTMMLKLMKENREKLGINALPEHFDSTIAVTQRMLQHKSLDLQLQKGILHGDTMSFSLRLLNKAGHKFPSGYPARRVWVEFVVTDQNNKTLFHSGRMNPDFSLVDEDTQFEPHYQVINSPDQVQVYELVTGDVKGLFTNVLERAHVALKDNRLTPQGFSTTHPAYDTTRIYGAALQDPDFNRLADGSQGSGADVLHFRIANPGYKGLIRVKAKVWYQSLPPKWMAPLFEYTNPAIDSFKTMFFAADRSPVLVAEQVLDSVYVSTTASKNIDNQRNIKIQASSESGLVKVLISPDHKPLNIQVWNNAGNMVFTQKHSQPFYLPEQSGVYLIMVETKQGKMVKKVMRY